MVHPHQIKLINSISLTATLSPEPKRTPHFSIILSPLSFFNNGGFFSFLNNGSKNAINFFLFLLIQLCCVIERNQYIGLNFRNFQFIASLRIIYIDQLMFLEIKQWQGCLKWMFILQYFLFPLRLDVFLHYPEQKSNLLLLMNQMKQIIN